jgi:hypothetical protein
METSVVSALKQSTKNIIVKVAKKKVMQTTGGKIAIKVGSQMIEYTSKQLAEKTAL